MTPQLRHIITSAIVLGLFGLLGTGVVATTQALTETTIAQNQIKARLKLLHEVLPAQSCKNNLVENSHELPAGSVTEDAPATVFFCRDGSQLMAVALQVVAGNGYSGPIKLLVGIQRDGSVYGVRVLEHKETPGLGDKIDLRKGDWVLSFNGKAIGPVPLNDWAVKRDGGIFDQFTGATITPRAVTQAVKDSLLYFNAQRENLIESND